jgi:membrane protease YdiL (CAAX protease family)
MERLNIASFVFLIVLFVLLPRAALRSARMLRQAHAEGKMPPRKRIVISTLFSLTVIWFISAMNGISMQRSLFSLENVGLREIGIGVAAFALLLLAIPISRAMRRPEEERQRIVFSMAPRTPGEFGLFVLVAVAAGIAEESAYRGVAIWILTPVFGSIVPAIFLSAMSFSVAHAVQGGKTMAMIFAIALVFHALVYLTGTLVIAMVVHAAYDIVAGYAAAKRAKRIEAEDAAAAGLGAGLGAIAGEQTT